MKILSDRITKVLEATGVDQKTLARMADVTDQSVSQWISGATKTMKGKAAFNLQRETGFSAEWLMYGDGSMMAEGGFQNRLIEEIARKVEAMEPAQQRMARNLIDTFAEGDPASPDDCDNTRKTGTY